MLSNEIVREQSAISGQGFLTDVDKPRREGVEAGPSCDHARRRRPARQFAGMQAAGGGPADMARPPLLEPEDRFERLAWNDGVPSRSTSRALRGLARPTQPGFGRVHAGGSEWRTFATIEGRTETLLAQRTSARRELAYHAAIEISLVIAATMLVVWMIVTFTVSRGVRRFEEVGAGVAARGVEAHGPLPLGGLPSEILPLANAMTRISRGEAHALVSNVVDNAVAYTPRGGSVDCTLRCEGATAMIEVVDTGPGVAPEHLPRLFDRFFRAAPSTRWAADWGSPSSRPSPKGTG